MKLKNPFGGTVTQADVDALPGLFIQPHDWSRFTHQFCSGEPTFGLEKSLMKVALDKRIDKRQATKAVERIKFALKESVHPSDPMEVLHRAQHQGFEVDRDTQVLLAEFLVPMVEHDFPHSPTPWRDVFTPTETCNVKN